ncbi:hypothetical protein D9M68_762120 [compost metagenome]
MQAPVGDGQAASGDVANALKQLGNKLVARNRDKQYPPLQRLSLIGVLLVQPGFQRLAKLVADALLAATIDRKEGPTVRHQHPHQAILAHAVEVADPGFGHVQVHGLDFGLFLWAQLDIGQRCRAHLGQHAQQQYQSA